MAHDCPQRQVRECDHEPARLRNRSIRTEKTGRRAIRACAHHQRRYDSGSRSPRWATVFHGNLCRLLETAPRRVAEAIAYPLSAYPSSPGNGSVARSNELNHLPIERGSISIASIEPSLRFLDHRIHGCRSHRSCYRPQLRGISIARQGAFERLNCGGRAFPVGRSTASGGEI